jgi:hypothetical protein
MARNRRKAAAPQLPTVRHLLKDVAEGIRVLQTRDGVDVSDEQILERARNIVTGLIGNYSIRALDGQEGRATPSRSVDQMDLLAKLEERAEARNRSGRA